MKNLMAKTLIFLLPAFLIISCGGDGSAPGNTSTLEKWTLVNTGIDSIVLGLERRNNVVYISHNASNTTTLASTIDGESFQYFTTNNTSELVSFIDETNRIHLRGSHSDNGINFITKTDEIPFGGLVNGSSSALIANWYMTFKNNLIPDPLKLSLDGGDTWLAIDLDNDTNTSEYIMPTEPGFNGAFLLADFNNGLWFSNNSGTAWTKILTSAGHFETVAANTNFPNRFYAAKLDALYRSDDNGTNWNIKIPSNLITQSITEWLALILADNGDLYALGIPNNSPNDRGQIFQSTDGGTTWSIKGEPIGYSRNSAVPLTATKMVVNDNYIFVLDDEDIYKLAR